MMVISTPVIDLLRGPPSDEDRTGRVHLVEQLPGRPRRPVRVRDGAPLVQPVEAVAAGVARFVVGAGDVPVEGIDM